MAPIRNTRSSKRTEPSALDQSRRSTLTAGVTNHRYPTSLPESSSSPEGLPNTPDNPRPPPLDLQHLECVRTLGQGVYGKVVLVRVQRDASKHPLDKPGTLFAMKIIEKISVARGDKKNSLADVNFERKQLSHLPWSPFVNGIVQTFFDEKNLYLMLEFIPHGSLHTAIQKRGPFDRATAAFYYSNIVCGLGYLQQHDVVHCDLKPDNILMGPDGYLCLADFGQAKKDDDKDSLWHMVGTPAYMAPELIEHKDYIGHPIDWWASGCILIEMLTRKMPFYRRNDQSATFKAIVAGEYTWPPGIRLGHTLKNLIAGLLTLKSEERLGTNGAGEVTEHPWLANVDWEKMQSRQYIAPYIPKSSKLTQLWLDQPLPDQETVPSLPVADPPLHLQHDQRFPPKKQL